MAGKKRQKIKEKDLVGFKYFKVIHRILERLHWHATERDTAGNRTLHFDQYIALQLLFFFNPIVSSMRGIVEASHLKKVRRRLRVKSTSLGSYSEAGSVFDAEQLMPIIRQLGNQLQPLKHDSRLDDLPGQLLAVDGTELTALGNLVDRAYQGREFKLHTHYDVLKGVPCDINMTEAKANEKDNLADRLQPDHVYVMDRGYARFTLFQDIIDAGSHFVCRIRDNSVYKVVEDHSPRKGDIPSGVISDQTVDLGSVWRNEHLRQPLRLIKLECKPHVKRSNRHGGGGPNQKDHLLIATNIMDCPASVIALIYRKRWTIELFFRFFKHVLGCRHLMSRRANGITIQAYCAIIVCMLIALWTGRKPTLRTVEMIQFHFTGWADEEELDAHIAKLQNLN